MAQSYYTLSQAAELLGISVDELNQMVRRSEIRAFADGGGWKFRTQDIDDLKRSREDAGDDWLSSTDEGGAGGEEVLLFDAGDSSPDAGGGTLSRETPSKGSGESDVRLIFEGEDGGSDSGIRLVADEALTTPSDWEAAPTPPGDSGARLIEEFAGDAAPTEAPPTIPLPSDSTGDAGLAGEAPPAGSGLSGGFEVIDDDDEEAPVLAAATPTKPMPAPADAAVSPKGEFDFTFEDSESSLKVEDSDEVDLAALDLSDKTPTLRHPSGDDDSDSDFSLSLDDDIGLAQDVAPGAGDSGINLGRPNDSGILLKSAADSGIKLASDTDTSDSEFDVSLDSDDDIFDSDEAPGFKASDTAPRLAPVKESEDDLSDSDFELVIDEEAEAEEESGSEVVALDDEDEESEEFDEEFDEESPYGDREPGETVFVERQPAPWHAGWVAAISFTTIVFVVVLMMMFEITRNAWSYNQPYALNATIIEWFYGIGQSMGIMP
jgi:excisionase family DNA binding protein